MKLNPLFSDNAVLQRERPIPVWGRAKAGEKISVALAGQTREIAADGEGNFRTIFDALPAGGPHTLTVKGFEGELVCKNILVGEVWIASGQSNMQWPVSGSADYEAEAAAANYPSLRMFNVAQVALMEAQTEAIGYWAVCDPRTVGQYSAVGYFFARELQQRLGGIPVGVINASWGGSLAEAWTSREGLLSEPELRPLVEAVDRFQNDKVARAAHDKAMKDWQNLVPKDPGDTGWAQGWAGPDIDEADWSQMALPGLWQSKGLDFSGVLWFRREVVLPDSWAGRDLQLSVGACDKSDITWFNSEQVGSIKIEDRPDAWSVLRYYRIPGKLVKAGRNTIAVRVFSNMYGGGMNGPKDQMYVALADGENAPVIPLPGDWRYRIEKNFGQTPEAPLLTPGDGNHNTPTILFNSMISPLAPYALRGAIWYQGESNADRAMQYRTLFPTLIRDWRRVWKQGDFPFHFVQLANFMEAKPEPGESGWAELREAQFMTLKEPNTGMAVAVDIGDALDIHPTNKQDVGRRLAYWSLAHDFGQNVIASGPLLRDWKVEGNSLRLYFDYAEGGLTTHDNGPLRGFAIAATDRCFQWGWARIEGDTVIVRHPQIPNPAAVRYAWSDNPSCNLVNHAGLPASPFRTDAWPKLPVPAQRNKS